ncbi:23S rRNA (adenine(2503)-C(2))-methyltransferase RlmN [Rhodohalobacter barkolensis]|uniref:Probable dual-specificity RNA methyltransferase RlmN n=1 Tax=Rhodohalobacter barkolensis TaxID=2053187 RepID=A0A2N0VHE3_9BACT|nr:23S rRNA (adenine(2503)-C(2))-methyltransferase RlmN [Rhodohalobacter barkolensis]PKD43603.1 23S rRNA (adenine(2503)-C(2))-methyltransferase RlmN [Rhodohalobacter barkolensis]
MTKVKTDTQLKTDLKSLTKAELSTFLEELGLAGYRSDQVFQWLYQKGVSSFDEMTNLSKDLRAKLDEIAEVKKIKVHSKQESSDGTIKFLFELDDPNAYKVEAVMIPDFYPDGAANRLTVCVSSQVGCMFGCSFCATGKMGYFRSLTHGEIVDQVQIINELTEERFDKKITNIVYMGMGEPLHNYKAVVESARIISDPLGIDLSPRRITISTVGLTKQIKQLADEEIGTNLAISLHAADDKKRDEIMPINESLNLEKLEEAVKYHFMKTEQPLTYEYLLFDEFNDSPQDAHNLVKIARWVPSKVNIIMYNNVAGVALKRAREERLNKFMKTLTDQGVTATVRRSRGDDIDAGCGQLAIREGQEKGKSLAKA